MCLKNILFASLILLSYSLTAQNSRVYVNPTATGSNDGTSWANAFTNLQTAIDSSTISDTLWLAAGTYLPTLTPAGPGVTHQPRDRTFLLQKN